MSRVGRDIQRRPTAGPLSALLAQHWPSIEWTSRVCRDVTYSWYRHWPQYIRSLPVEQVATLSGSVEHFRVNNRCGGSTWHNNRDHRHLCVRVLSVGLHDTAGVTHDTGSVIGSIRRTLFRILDSIDFRRQNLTSIDVWFNPHTEIIKNVYMSVDP